MKSREEIEEELNKTIQTQTKMFCTAHSDRIEYLRNLARIGGKREILEWVLSD